ncbi:TonB-dependent receptor [Pseudoalteromonas sp. MMG010]|uniref:TonB-dependent receptor n=1 Tax=Pseudoalteromonas sp. MMG010 TaxID=2822685 RepID=UPI001B39FA33|nr:TonB-dependent receptor [Pseudoalteromonas sp. MMG010]MBQ4832068.1 TonB-dependent receptor [Pseudoalteromonas sp. MMG010]
MHLSFFIPLVLSINAVHAKPQQSMERITTTAARTTVNSTPLPVVVSSIEQAQLDLIAPTHIEQVLKQVAGANVQHGNGQEYLPALRSSVLSGAGACGAILTAEDGIPLRAAGFCNINELFEAHSEMAQRIEVLKGPGSALYGSNAMHGVINVITPDTTYNEHQLGLELGSYGYSRVKVRTGKDMGNQGIGLNASITNDTGYRDDESVKQQKLNLRHRYNQQNFTLNSGLTYTNLDQKTAGFITGYQSYKNSETAQANFDPNAFRKAQSFRVWSKAVWQTDKSTLTITPYARSQKMTFFKHFLPGTPLEENSQNGIGMQSLWHYNYTTDIALNIGLDSEYTRADFLQYQNEPTEGSDFLVATVPQGKHYDYDVNSILLAPFMSIDWQWQKLKLSVGARFEQLNYQYTNNMLTGRTKEDGTQCSFGGCRYSRPPSGDNKFSNLSPKFGLSYKINNAHYVYANASQGYRAPQASELYQLQREQSVADLNPETANNLELGFKGKFKQLNYVLSAYSMKKDNVIFRDSDFFTINDAKTEHQGIELEINYPLTQSLQFALSATHANHRYRYNQILSGININGNMIDTAPKNIANMQLNWQPTDNATLALEWHHVSQYFTDAENSHNYAGHNLLNLRAAWQLNNRFTLSARINNVANTAYADRADYTSFTGDRYFPGKPRNIVLAANYHW